MPKLKSNELEWQAEYDADTMARYQEIMSNSKRKQAAMKAAKRKAQDLEKSYTNMKNVYKKGGKKR